MNRMLSMHFSVQYSEHTASRYITALHSYLLSFTKRTRPLFDIESQQREVEVEFDTKWEAGEITGWEESNAKTQDASNGAGQGIWCSACKYNHLAPCTSPDVIV